MKRLFGGFLVLSMTVAAFMYIRPAVAASVDNFVINKYDVQLYLGRDNENRSTLKTVETIAATFPEIDQNHGIERTLVNNYDGHTTGLRVESVTDTSGKPLDYKQNGDVVRIGSASTYVHGVQTYRITYTQRDVTKHYKDTGKDEFYWDVIGGEWRVSIEAASATIHLADTLKPAAQTNPYCYYGASGSTTSCPVEQKSGETMVATANGIGAGKGMTMAIGFASKTFAPYKPSALDELFSKGLRAWLFATFIGGPLVLIGGGVILWRKLKAFKRDPEIDNIEGRSVIPEYLPPSGRSVLESAAVYHSTIDGKALTAQIVDWAVRRYVDIRQTKEKSLLSTAEYTVEAKKSFEDLSEYEQKLATTLFEQLPKVGDSFTTKDLVSRSMEITGSLSTRLKDVKKGDLFTKNEAAAKWFKKVATITGLFGLLLIINVPLIILAIIAAILANTATYRNIAGATLRHYLEGLKDYIGVAEVDRLAMLQSPDGAEKVGVVNVGDKGALVKLYERVLPYAILFGQEKEWTKELGRLYEESGVSPTWSTSGAMYNAAAFSTMMNSFSSAVTSASSYSSSGGGSGGGGSSGGGGGGW